MTSSSLADRGRQLKALSSSRLPDAVVETFARSLAELTAAGVPAGVAPVGTPLPDVSLVDPLGEATSLFAAAGGQPTVLVFYRGAWCPYCNLALKTYRDELFPVLSRQGIGMIAISPQKPDGSLSMQEKHDLAFPVLSDSGNALATALGILMPTRDDDLRAAQEQLGLDLAQLNADGTEAIPMATVVIADAEHVIQWIDVRPDFTERAEVADILAAAETALGDQSPG